MLRLKTTSVDAFVQNIHGYGGEAQIAQYNNLSLALENLVVGLAVPDKPLLR